MEYVFYLTNNCNLKCKYCYEGDKSNNKISIDIIKELLSKEVDSKEKVTKVAFFGGEPLLEKEILYETVNFANELTKKTKHKFVYTLTTNGTLIDDEFIRFCKKNKISIAISLDGDKTVQNLNRIDYDGKGSFDIVLENTKKCLKAKLNCMAVPVIGLNNLRYFSSSIKYLIDLGFKSITCNLNYSDNWDDDSIEILKQQYKEVANLYYDEYKKKNYIRIYPLDTKIFFHIHNEMSCADSCKVDRIAVNTDGSFYPCLQYVGDERFKIGDYKNGVDKEKRKELLLKRIKSKVACEECALKKRCLYQCGCARLMTTNDIVDISPVICETEQICIKEADELAEKLYKDFKKQFTILNY